MWRNDHYQDYVRVETRVYADEEEQAAIELCHEKCVDVLDDFVRAIGYRGYVRALDVAGGDGRMTSSKVMKPYNHVDFFDQCPVAIKKAVNVMRLMKNGGKIFQSSM